MSNRLSNSKNNNNKLKKNNFSNLFGESDDKDNQTSEEMNKKLNDTLKVCEDRIKKLSDSLKESEENNKKLKNTLKENEDKIKELSDSLKESEDKNKKLINSIEEIKTNINNGNIAQLYLDIKEENEKIKNENERLKNENKLFDTKTTNKEIIDLNQLLNINLEKEKIKIFN